MPRRSYEQHRAGRLLSASGRGTSVVESETDAESLASFSTYQSNSSYLTSNLPLPSPRLGSFSSNGHSHGHDTFSSSSRYFASTSNGIHGPTHLSTGQEAGPSRIRHPSPSSIHGLSPSPGLDFRQRAFSSSSSQSPALTPHLEPGRLHRGSTGNLEEDRARRKRRREERVRKSTLRGETYDSPLRRTIRWASTHGWSDFSLPLGLGIVLAQRILLVLLDSKSRGGMRWKNAAVELGSEVVLVWTSAISWLIRQAKKEGRSWRSQWSGIMTLLLSPSLFMLSTDSSSSTMQLGLLGWTITLLSADQDIAAALCLSLAASMGASGWWYIPATVSYLAGKSFWKGRRNGLTHASKWLLALFSAILLQRFIGSSVNQLLAPLSIAEIPSPLTPPAACTPWHTLKSWLHIDNYITPTGQTWISSMATAATIAPPIMVLLYASLSMGKANTTSTSLPPTIRLLLPGLFTTSTGAFLFSSTSSIEYLSQVLLPLGLMMSLRGGKDTGKGENEVWEMGVILHNLVALLSLSTTATVLSMVGRIARVIFWNWVIGYNPLSVQSESVRVGGNILYGLSAFAATTHIVTCHSGSHTASTMSDISVLVQQSVLVVTLVIFWIWGNMKLIEGTWAITGLGSSLGSGTKTIGEEDKGGKGKGTKTE